MGEPLEPSPPPSSFILLRRTEVTGKDSVGARGEKPKISLTRVLGKQPTTGRKLINPSAPPPFSRGENRLLLPGVRPRGKMQAVACFPHPARGARRRKKQAARAPPQAAWSEFVSPA